MRRHQIAGLVWQTVHLPLHLATIIAGAAVALFIADGEQMALLQLEVERNGSLTSSQLNTLLSEQTINRSLDIFIICIGIILVHLFFLSLLHKQPTKGNERLFPSWIIISARLAAAGGLFALMSGAHHWSPVQVLQITCGTWLVLVVVNIVGMKRKNASMKDTLCHFDLAQR